MSCDCEVLAQDGRICDACKRKRRQVASLCVECGPNVKVDEDGCCKSCGATATGAWLDRNAKTVAPVCVRCGSTDRGLDLDFHCSTCWGNLLARREALKNDLFEARQALIREGTKADQYQRDWMEAKHEFGTTTSKLRERVASLEGALRKHGIHGRACHAGVLIGYGPEPGKWTPRGICTCGLDAALAGTR